MNIKVRLMRLRVAAVVSFVLFALVGGALASPAQADTISVPVTIGRCIPSPTHECPPMIVSGGAAYFAIVPGYSVVGLINPDIIGPELINPNRPVFTITIVKITGTGGALVCKTPAVNLADGESVTTTASCDTQNESWRW